MPISNHWQCSIQPSEANHSIVLAKLILNILKEHREETEFRESAGPLYRKICKTVGLDFDAMDIYGDNGGSMAARLEEARQKGWIKVIDLPTSTVVGRANASGDTDKRQGYGRGSWSEEKCE